jgi:signal transduction histidine kinase
MYCNQDYTSKKYVKIIDYGVGIPQEELGAIFERFYRVDKARSRKIGGVGLGLPTALNIAQFHSGTITINSTLGQGTMVTIQLNKNR